MCNPIRLAVLASGSGTNLQAIIDATENGTIQGEVALVLSDKPEAYALERARKHGIPMVVVERKNCVTKEEFEEKLAEHIQAADVDLVLLAGFMRILSPIFLRHFPGKVLNIHPSLLPAFPGLDAQGQALNHGVRVTGCTVHFVDEGMDTGPIILQAAVPVFADDTLDELVQRILREEHRIFPEAVRLYQQGRLLVEGRKVRVVSEKGQDRECRLLL